MTRYVLIDKIKGVFLGVDPLRNPCFADENRYCAANSCSFEYEKLAKNFAEDSGIWNNDTILVKVDTNGPFVSVVDIIKAGHGDHVFDMINYIPMQSKEIH